MYNLNGPSYDQEKKLVVLQCPRTDRISEKYNCPLTPYLTSVNELIDWAIDGLYPDRAAEPLLYLGTIFL